MSDDETPGRERPHGGPRSQDRKARLGARLRDNLRRRRVQARGRQAAEPDDDAGDPADKA